MDEKLEDLSIVILNLRENLVTIPTLITHNGSIFKRMNVKIGGGDYLCALLVNPYSFSGCMIGYLSLE